MNRKVFCFLMTVVALWAGAREAPAAQVRSCDILQVAAKTFGASGSLDELRALFQEVRGRTDCGGDLEQAIRFDLSSRLFARGEQAQLRGRPAVEVERDLRESLVYRYQWRAFERLGDLAMLELDYAEAALRYVYAIHTIANERVTSEPPGPGDIDRVLRKFSAVWTVADYYVRPLPILIGGPQSRKWHREISWASALGVDPLRGHTPASPLLPITFKFASAQLSRHAGEALVILKSLLDRIGSPTLRLAGNAGEHEREVDAGLDLDALALARAETVRTWFEERNYKGGVVIEAGAELAPFTPADGLEIPPRVLNWFERRVEYRWDAALFLPDGSDAR